MQMQSAPNFKDLQKEFTTKKLSNLVVMQAATRLMNRRTLEKLKEIVAGDGKKAKAKAEEDVKPNSESTEKETEVKKE